MAKSTLICFALVFTLFAVMPIAESRPLVEPTDPICQKIYAVQEGETSSGIIQRFKLDENHFLELNPNITCASIFVGQWVCTEGQVV
ncbi:hypothetical protein L6164_037376 [Bauhinia variegata]|uniref:Uncharacterized protein n=1 Tax=Bauhinia variegata TaxID=167791 RepID=A0ACB9KJZ5_BAUVA|nr:hypothetical protein L6164_037376 [Bauhinia variegata]